MNLEIIFEEVSEKFPEVKSKVKPFKKNSVMRSSSITGDIYYNPAFTDKFSKKALRGIFAHELAHQIDMLSWSVFRKLFHRFLYRNFEYKTKVERAADTILIQRGFGKDWLVALDEMGTVFGKERLAKFKKAHLSVKEVKRAMSQF